MMAKELTRTMARSYGDLRSARAWSRTAVKAAAGEAFSVPVPIPNAAPAGEDEKEYARHCDYRLWLFTQRVSGGSPEEEALEYCGATPPSSGSRLEPQLFDSLQPFPQQQLIFGLDV
mmetsp:Transcript_16996/g.53063  ORF Transcript_16996/g.53063 Transcript_16996/m.53063 type:complete len:117 (+) Transcript_16996:128-478(+)